MSWRHERARFNRRYGPAPHGGVEFIVALLAAVTVAVFAVAIAFAAISLAGMKPPRGHGAADWISDVKDS